MWSCTNLPQDGEKLNVNFTSHPENGFLLFPLFPPFPNWLYAWVCLWAHRPGQSAGSRAGSGGLLAMPALARLQALRSLGCLLPSLPLCWCVGGHPSAMPQREKSLKELNDFFHHWRIWQVYPKGFCPLLRHWTDTGDPVARSRLETVESHQHRDVGCTVCILLHKLCSTVSSGCEGDQKSTFLRIYWKCYLDDNPGADRGDIHPLAQNAVHTSGVDWSALERFLVTLFQGQTSRNCFFANHPAKNVPLLISV